MPATYEPEIAANLYAELAEALRLRPDMAAVYNAFNHTFQRLLYQRQTHRA